MIILLLINILELLAITCLLWTLFEQITKYENMKDSRDNAGSWLEKTEKEQDYWRDEYYRSTSKMLEEREYERWKPKDGEKYWFVNDVCNVYFTNNAKDEFDIDKINSYNCFKTKEQAEAEAEKILVRRMLEDIARRLNKGKKIDWNDEKQTKSFIFLDCATQLIKRDCNIRHKFQGVVYCLDTNFRKIAIQEIGEERLKKYLRGN